MVIYNTDFMNNATSVRDLIEGIGQATGNTFIPGYFLLMAFFMIVLVFSFRQDFKKVLIVDGFLSTILAIFLYTAQLLPSAAIMYPFIIFLIALLMFFLS